MNTPPPPVYFIILPLFPRYTIYKSETFPTVPYYAVSVNKSDKINLIKKTKQESLQNQLKTQPTKKSEHTASFTAGIPYTCYTSTYQ